MADPAAAKKGQFPIYQFIANGQYKQGDGAA